MYILQFSHEVCGSLDFADLQFSLVKMLNFIGRLQYFREIAENLLLVLNDAILPVAIIGENVFSFESNDAFLPVAIFL